MLDDALEFVDHDRFEVMFYVLAEAAQRMHTTMLGCRTNAYRGLEVRWLPLA